jgi:hypothetical protein
MLKDVAPSRAKTICLLLVLSTLLLGLCPLAPAKASAPAGSGPCQHEHVPASSPHSCCVSVHHQAVLVRAMVEDSHAVAVSPCLVKPLIQTTNVVAATTINLAASPPLLSSVLRL